jgi:CRP-like cAMP-binding protein
MAAVAERGCELEQMDREGFWQMLVAKPSLSLDVLQILAAETRSARIAIVELGSKRRMVRRKKG